MARTTPAPGARPVTRLAAVRPIACRAQGRGRHDDRSERPQVACAAPSPIPPPRPTGLRTRAPRAAKAAARSTALHLRCGEPRRLGSRRREREGRAPRRAGAPAAAHPQLAPVRRERAAGDAKPVAAPWIGVLANALRSGCRRHRGPRGRSGRRGGRPSSVIGPPPCSSAFAIRLSSACETRSGSTSATRVAAAPADRDAPARPGGTYAPALACRDRQHAGLDGTAPELDAPAVHLAVEIPKRRQRELQRIGALRPRWLRGQRKRLERAAELVEALVERAAPPALPHPVPQQRRAAIEIAIGRRPPAEPPSVEMIGSVMPAAGGSRRPSSSR